MDMLVAHAAAKTAHEKLFTVELQRYIEFKLDCGPALRCQRRPHTDTSTHTGSAGRSSDAAP